MLSPETSPSAPSLQEAEDHIKAAIRIIGLAQVHYFECDHPLLGKLAEAYRDAVSAIACLAAAGPLVPGAHPLYELMRNARSRPMILLADPPEDRRGE